MKAEVMLKACGKVRSVVSALERKLLAEFGVSEPKHFAHITNNLLSPVQAYAELAGLGMNAPAHDEAFRVCLHHLIGYVHLLRDYCDFARDEILKPEGHFPEFKDCSAVDYVRGSLSSI